MVLATTIKPDSILRIEKTVTNSIILLKNIFRVYSFIVNTTTKVYLLGLGAIPIIILLLFVMFMTTFSPTRLTFNSRKMSHLTQF
jgi:hypothetical protein